MFSNMVIHSLIVLHRSGHIICAHHTLGLNASNTLHFGNHNEIMEIVSNFVATLAHPQKSSLSIPSKFIANMIFDHSRHNYLR